MTNYYFLAASLPPLVLGEVPDITFTELSLRLEINLTKEDFKKTVVLRRFIDLLNIRALFLEEPIDNRGNLTEKELDEALLIRDILPEYVFDFLDRYESPMEKVRYFPALVVRFFLEEIPQQEGFVRRYLEFERAWRLVLLALRAKSLGRDVMKELQFEDVHSPIVAQIIAQRDAERYEPPAEYEEVRELLISCGSDPLLQHKVFAEWRFRKVEEMVDTPLFSIDWILAYMARLLILESINELDEKKGKMIMDTVIHK
jgi:hypothetical protein